MQFSMIETFDRAPEEVFAAMTNIDAFGDWLPGFVRVERLTSGRVGVGTTWRVTRKVFGREATEQFEITQYVPAERLTIHVDGSKGSMGRGAFEYRYGFVPQGEGTKLVVDTEVSGLGVLGKMLAPLIKRPLQNAMRKDREAFRQWLDDRHRD